MDYRFKGGAHKENMNMAEIKRTVERRDGQSYLVLYVKADSYGVIDPGQLEAAVELLIGQTPRAMPNQDIVEALHSAAAAHDVPL
jgi:hypothetical protein